MDAVVSAKVSQLRIDFRIKPVGLEHRGFKVVQILCLVALCALGLSRLALLLVWHLHPGTYRLK
jgi:hypothetical protein